jgi:hypothetical protein
LNRFFQFRFGLPIGYIQPFQDVIVRLVVDEYLAHEDHLERGKSVQGFGLPAKLQKLFLGGGKGGGHGYRKADLIHPVFHVCPASPIVTGQTHGFPEFFHHRLKLGLANRFGIFGV